MGAMNRLKEVGKLSDEAAWRLAAAYHLAGQQSTAKKLVADRSMTSQQVEGPSQTFGGPLRNQALVLETLVLLGDPRADALASTVATALSSDAPYNTQSTAYALVALSRYGIAQPGTSFEASWNWAGGKEQTRTISEVVSQIDLSVSDADTESLIVRNPSSSDLFVQIARSGVPALAKDLPSARNLELAVSYRTDTDESIDPAVTPHGADLTVAISVRNTGPAASDLALSFVVPSGWELFGLPAGPGVDFTYRDVRDDRVLTYFDLKAGETRTFIIPVNAAYLGRFYRPPVVVEHMYDPGTYARTAGDWTEVILTGGPS